MNIHYNYFLITFVVFTCLQSAYSLNSYNGFDVENSIIPKEEILSGGPPKDGIPAIINPKFESASKVNWLKDGDLVAGVNIGGIKKAFPVKILVWHELANDNIGNTHYLVTYCPLCGSILVFSRNINNKIFTFGVSGLLYQSDVLFYDHQTESLWSQLKMKSISGKMINKDLELLPYTFSTWKDWVSDNPNTLVLSKDTGFKRNYDLDPYSSYYSSKNLYFPVNRKSDKFHPKEKVLVITSGDLSKAYPFSYLKKIKQII